MTSKEAFRLADSILRYQYIYETTIGDDYAPRHFDDERIHKLKLEAVTIPDNIMGVVCKYHLGFQWATPKWYAGRIMKMHREKQYDINMLIQGWVVERPKGCNMVMKRARANCDYCGDKHAVDYLNKVGESLACHGCVEDAVIEAYTGENTQW